LDLLNKSGVKISTEDLSKRVKAEMLKLGSQYEAPDEVKVAVIDEFFAIIHWMAKKGIVQREDHPTDDDQHFWSKGNGRYTPTKKPLTYREQPKPEPKTTPKEEDDDEVPDWGKSEEMEKLENRVESLEGQIVRYAEVVGKQQEEIERLKKKQQVEYTIVTDNKPVKIKEKVHEVFPQVLFHLKCGDFPMLVGPSGCGKTELAMQMARHLKKDFGMLSWHGGMTESQLYGKTVPNITGGKEIYIPADFAEFYESGGLFLHDEIDGGDPNVLLSLNGPLSNKRMKLPRKVKPLIEMHKDFVCLATANTWGNGADRHYVGRNQMDGATVKRFVLIDMDYDEKLEIALCPGEEAMVERLQEYRRKLVYNKLQRVIDTRFILRAYKWKRCKKDDEYVDTMLFKGWRQDEERKVKGLY
jgi:energy-coupling factor transporter ATP-binding protein EcfA2